MLPHGIFILQSPVVTRWHAAGVQQFRWPSKFFERPVVRACLEQCHLSITQLYEVSGECEASSTPADDDNLFGNRHRLLDFARREIAGP